MLSSFLNYQIILIFFSATFAPITLCYVTFIIGSFFIIIYKTHHWRKVRRISQLAQSVVIPMDENVAQSPPQLPPHSYNNQQENQSILGNFSLVLFGILVITMFMPLLLMQIGEIPLSNPLQYYGVFIMTSIFLPSLYFFRKPKCIIAVFSVLFQLDISYSI